VTDTFLISFALPLFIGFSATCVIDLCLKPCPLWFWRRHHADILLNLGLWIVIFFIEFLQYRRPWLTCLIAIVIYAVCVLINNAKFKVLREPFLYQDIDYLKDLVRHPKLYLPFFGIGKTFICLGIAIALICCGLISESPLLMWSGTDPVWPFVFFFLFSAVLLIWFGSKAGPTITCDPVEDVRNAGLLAAIWRYSLAERRPLPQLRQFSNLPSMNQVALDIKKTNIVVVQSESFFDPRRYFESVKPSVLKHFDQTCRQSIKYGKLDVPAWGANTVRTEFAFLTGIANSLLGIDKFNPYRRSTGTEIPSIARLLKQLGYRTVCIHPYPASFYDRDKVFPRLGFDHFIDIKAFDQAQSKSVFVSDLTLVDKVIELLDVTKEDEALFVFVITMENHGPLHLERLSDQQFRRWFKKEMGAHAEDLAVYLSHLANADLMIQRLTQALSDNTRPGLLAWFGDHVPMMSKVYKELGMPEGSTDYFIWRTSSEQRTYDLVEIKNLAVHELAVHILSAATTPK